MTERHTHQSDLVRLAAQARRDFGHAAFWTIPVSTDPFVEARIVGHQLEKHGGMAGIAFAAEIEKALQHSGKPSWR